MPGRTPPVQKEKKGIICPARRHATSLYTQQSKAQSLYAISRAENATLHPYKNSSCHTVHVYMPCLHFSYVRLLAGLSLQSPLTDGGDVS